MTDTLFTKSFFSLDEESPSSWGKYYVSESNDRTNIERYYDVSNKNKPWTLNYMIHGILGFYDDGDSFYMDAIGDKYDVPIKAVS